MAAKSAANTAAAPAAARAVATTSADGGLHSHTQEGPVVDAINHSPRITAQLASLQRIYGNHHVPAQRKPATAAPGTITIQRAIDTSVDDWDSWADADAMPANGFAGLPGTASKAVTEITATTAPADPSDDFQTWKDEGYVSDPARGNRQALTRMHAIRGRFGGPSAANNMFLGTAPSNNLNANSHYSLVESPLHEFLIDGEIDETRAFDYRVTPNTDNIPAYMRDRIRDEVADEHEGDFTTFANAHIPNGFTCEADLYVEKNDEIGMKTVTQDVDTDIDADEGGEDED